MAVETNPIEVLKNGLGERFRLKSPRLSSLPSIPLFKKTGTVPVVSDIESEVITNPIKTIADLEAKGEIMQVMINNNQVYQPVVGRMRLLVRDLWFSNMVSDGGIKGLGNLHWGVSWATAQNKRLAFLGPHEADADHMVLEYELGRAGFEDLRDKLVYLGGLNMKKRPSIERLTRAADVIYNVTPRDEHHLRELLARKDEFGLDEDQLKRLEGIKHTFGVMSRKSMRAVVENCVKRKKPMVAYIEGGRRYDDYMRQPLEEFSAIIPKDDSVVIVPYRLYGSRELNPPGKDPKILNKHLIPGLRQKVRMVVGEPYLSSEVWEVYKKRIEEAGASNGHRINPMDWPMAQIANLDQRFVRPEELLHYAELMEKYAPKRNRIILPDSKGSYASRIDGQDYPILRQTFPDNRIHRWGRKALVTYMRVWHSLDVQMDPAVPKKGPAFFLTNHDSNLTTVALMVADPYYPWTTVPVKQEFFKIPLAKQVLKAWGALSVNRDGKDTEIARELLNILAQGKTDCISAEGTRSRDGRLQPMDSSLIGLTLIAARRGYPIVPIAVYGSFEAMPPGRLLPKPEPITVKVGKPMDLSPWTSQKSTLEVKTGAARYMQAQLAALLPEAQKLGPDTKPMWDKKEYLPAKKKGRLFGKFF